MKLKFTKNTKNILKYLGIIILTLIPILIIMRSLNWQSKFLNKMILREGFNCSDIDSSEDDDVIRDKLNKMYDLKQESDYSDDSATMLNNAVFDNDYDSDDTLPDNAKYVYNGIKNDVCKNYNTINSVKNILDNSSYSTSTSGFFN